MNGVATRLLAAVVGLSLWIIAAEAAAEPVRLWHAYRGAEEEALAEILEGFDDAPVETLAIPHDAFAAKLSAAVPFGEGPHLFIDSHERLGDFRRQQIVAPAGAAFDPGAYTTEIADAVTIDAERYAVPIGLKSLALYRNRDLAGSTPPDLEGIAELQADLAPGQFALAYEAMNPYAHAPILHAFGGSLLGPDESFGFTGPEAEASLEFVRLLLASGALPSEADGALITNLFRAGKVAFVISGPWLASDVGDAVPYEVVPLPTLRASGQPMRPFLTIESVMLTPAGAENPAAVALAAHLGAAEAARTRQQIARTVSARADVDPAGDPLLEAFAAQARQAVPMPTSTAMRSTWEPAKQALRKVLRGDAEPHAALEEAEHRFRDIRRPPPDEAAAWPVLLALGAFTMIGALVLVRRARQPRWRARVRASIPAYRYLAHAVIAVGVLVIAPLVVGAATSLFAGPAGDIRYVGFANFVEILTARGGPLLASGSFYLVLLVTVAWTLVNLAFHLALGLGVGLLLSRPQLRMRSVYRVLLIVPWAVPNYVTALAWKGMFHRQFGAITGMINAANDLLGTSVEPISWFAQFSTAFTANVATNVWLGFPFMMVVTIGALTAVPKDVLEAAEVDGASRWQRLTKVTLPMIRPSLMPAVTLGAIWTFNMFNVVFLVSGGDPDGTTDILVSEAYRWAFTREAQYGYAAAYAVLIFFLLLGSTRLLERWKTAWASASKGVKS